MRKYRPRIQNSSSRIFFHSTCSVVILGQYTQTLLGEQPETSRKSDLNKGIRHLKHS